MVEDAVRTLAEASAHESKARELRQEALTQFDDALTDQLPDDLRVESVESSGFGFAAAVGFDGLDADLNAAFDESVTVEPMQISFNPVLDADAQEELEDGSVKDLIANLEQDLGAVPEQRVIDAATEIGIPEIMARAFLEHLQEAGRVYEPKDGHYRTI